MKYLIVITSIILVALTSSCGNKSSDSHLEEKEVHDEHENENTVSLSQAQMESINIELGAIEKKQLSSSLKANGILKVPNQNKATISSMIGGVVNSILVQAGTTVVKGQVVATISNSSFIAIQENYLSVIGKLNLATIENTRQKELQQGNATSQKLLQQSEAEVADLKTQKASLEKQLELIGIVPGKLTNENITSTVNITSPIAGSISHVLVNIGSYVSESIPVAEVIDNNKLHLDLFVYEKDLQKIIVGQIIHFTLTNNPQKEYDAQVYAVSNTFEEDTKAVAVHAEVKGDKFGLIDGMNITAIASLSNTLVDAVPTNAIISHEGQDFIFVVTDEHGESEHHEGELDSNHAHDEMEHAHDEKAEVEAKANSNMENVVFERIPVVKGTTEVGFSEITLLKDIPEGSKIVINGAFFILGKMNNKGEGHAH